VLSFVSSIKEVVVEPLEVLVGFIVGVSAVDGDVFTGFVVSLLKVVLLLLDTTSVGDNVDGVVVDNIDFDKQSFVF
jgi:hypothetical protein